MFSGGGATSRTWGEAARGVGRAGQPRSTGRQHPKAVPGTEGYWGADWTQNPCREIVHAPHLSLQNLLDLSAPQQIAVVAAQVGMATADVTACTVVSFFWPNVCADEHRDGGTWAGRSTPFWLRTGRGQRTRT